MNTKQTEALELALEFNRYFTSANGVDVPHRIPVPRDEWREVYLAFREALAEQPAQPKLIPMEVGRVDAGITFVEPDGKRVHVFGDSMVVEPAQPSCDDEGVCAGCGMEYCECGEKDD